MKERVESGRSETGSGEKRMGPLPVSQGGRELAWLRGRAGFQFGEGARRGRRPSQVAVGSVGSHPLSAAAYQPRDLGRVPQLL